MNIGHLASIFFCAAGAVFFLAGSIGMIRLPDVFLRLHASAKADNLGLAFVLVGVSIEATSIAVALKLALIWTLLIVSSATSCNLIAQKALRESAGEKTE